MDVESETEPPLVYERDPSKNNAMRRPYRIFLRSTHTQGRNVK